MARISIYEQWGKDGILQDQLMLIEGWAKDGLVQQQIADNLGISIDTLIRYKDKYSEFSEALKRGKEVVDREVENALFKRAMGYTTVETKIEGAGESQRITKTVKEVAPDVTAQIFWLKNRKPIEWRDKQEIAHSGDISVELTGDIKDWAK